MKKSEKLLLAVMIPALIICAIFMTVGYATHDDGVRYGARGAAALVMLLAVVALYRIYSQDKTPRD